MGERRRRSTAPSSNSGLDPLAGRAGELRFHRARVRRVGPALLRIVSPVGAGVGASARIPLREDLRARNDRGDPHSADLGLCTGRAGGQPHSRRRFAPVRGYRRGGLCPNTEDEFSGAASRREVRLRGWCVQLCSALSTLGHFPRLGGCGTYRRSTRTG